MLDTNVLVSAAIVLYGQPNQLLTAWENGAFHLLTSEALLAEFARTLHKERIRRKYHLTDERITELVATLATGSIPVLPREPLPLSSRDPHDDMFLAIALGGSADYLVTGDADLLVLNGDPARENTHIVTVRDFLTLLGQESV